MERLDRLLQSNGLTAYKPLSGQHTSPSPDNAKKHRTTSGAAGFRYLTIRILRDPKPGVGGKP